ncbi:MAG: hypothetical protein Q9P14_11645, partial [candidate division KSB1 bacterium]|nr:hypothetical protein [candidate division KSB1 bacterium]
PNVVRQSTHFDFWMRIGILLDGPGAQYTDKFFFFVNKSLAAPFAGQIDAATLDPVYVDTLRN